MPVLKDRDDAQYSAMKFLPEHCVDGVLDFIYHGQEPGDFLMCVLTNDLEGACGRADELNKYRLWDYVFFLHNYAPATCWGTEKKVQKWIAQKGLKGPLGAHVDLEVPNP